MVDFVDIKTVYDSPDELNVDNLAGLYQDTGVIRPVIHRMISTYLEPLGIEGRSILIKPNWVRHELTQSDYLCLRTNDNFLLCVLEEILRLRPAKILLADAPVQGCIWDRMITKTFLKQVWSLSTQYEVLVQIKDFRRTITSREQGIVETDLHPMSDYVLFDMGFDSYLEPVTTSDNKFRVTCYNPDKMAEVHHRGTHKYCIAKDVFDYDIIITVPKLKTHRMAGITNALKLLVGINGDKEFLPHHRIGAVMEGGDNYKDKSFLRTLSNKFLDESNRCRGTKKSKCLSAIGFLLWNYSKPDAATLNNAGWYGNDTIWRTVMDINKIALYGDCHGQIHKHQQRCLYTIMDGIIGGQGDGPLHPTPSALGVIAIANNSFLMDVVAGELYHLNYERVPLLREARKIIDNIDYKIIVNSRETLIEEVSQYGIDVSMSPGWADYNKQTTI